jgi:hypothetical protein
VRSPDIVVAAESSQEIDEVMKGLSLRWRITELVLADLTASRLVAAALVL